MADADNADAPRAAKRRRPDGLDADRASYRVRVRGRDFELSREQVLAEGENSFLACALIGDWREGATRASESPLICAGQERFVDLGTAHSPELFEIVVEHLAGYEVVPLSRAPPAMSLEQTTRNLLVMARFLDLPRLEAALVQPEAARQREALEAAQQRAAATVAFEFMSEPAPDCGSRALSKAGGRRRVRCLLRKVVFQCVNQP